MPRRDNRKRVTSTTQERACRLRRRPTFPEERLWSALRGKQLGGLRFRKQHPIEPYIVDFYCASARLAIELDGCSHDDTQASDALRTQYIEDQSIRVLRFTNDDVLTNLDGVLQMIARAAGLGLGTGIRHERVDLRGVWGAEPSNAPPLDAPLA